MRINVLGVEIDKIDLDTAAENLFTWIKTSGKHYVVTPNIEFIILAQKDKEFRRILNRSNLSIPDSARIGWAWRVLKQNNIFKKILIWGLFLFPKSVSSGAFPVTTGTDLMEYLIPVCSQKGYTIGLLGGGNNVAAKLLSHLKKKYPKLKVALAESDVVVNIEGEIVSGGNQLKQLELPIDLLFVAFGQGKQEKWIYKNLDQLPVKVMMGVGGAFDYLSGSVPRAPFWMRKLGFEWLYRLYVQPWRIKRFSALFIFIWLVLFRKSNKRTS